MTDEPCFFPFASPLNASVSGGRDVRQVWEAVGECGTQKTCCLQFTGHGFGDLRLMTLSIHTKQIGVLRGVRLGHSE